METHRFYSKMEELLKMSPGTIHGTAPLASLDGWDSLAILEFIILADTDYSVTLSPDQITACGTVDDLGQLTSAE